MKKMYALIVCMTVCGAALFAQTEADFEIWPDGDGGVVITGYTGQDGAVVIPAAIGGETCYRDWRQRFEDRPWDYPRKVKEVYLDPRPRMGRGEEVKEHKTQVNHQHSGEQGQPCGGQRFLLS